MACVASHRSLRAALRAGWVPATRTQPDSPDRALCRPPVGPRGERRLQGIDGLLVTSQPKQYQPKVIPGDRQGRSLSARRTQTVGRGAQSAVVVHTITSVEKVPGRGVESLDCRFAALTTVIDQTEKQARHGVVGNRLKDAEGEPLGPRQITVLI